MSEATSSRRAAVRNWALIFLAFTGIWLLNFSVVMTNEFAERSRLPWKYPFLWEMTGAYAVLVLLPGLLWFMRRYPIERRDLWRRVPLHLSAFVVYTCAHTLLMWGSRTVLYRLLGWGEYDYGVMSYRFLMEGGKQVFTYLGVFAVQMAFGYAERTREREVAAARLERELTEARLSALKMQLNPHFLFNTLHMISSHIADDPRTADAMIGHLSDFLRVTLRHAPAQEVPLDKEIEFLDDYLAIMKARFENRLVVEVRVSPDTRDALVPHLVLQPLVENSITHCMAVAGSTGRIRLSSAREGGRLRLTVEDNGPGLPEDGDAALARGVGLSNTSERLRHLYGDCQRLSLANRPEGGLHLMIEIPYRTADRRPATPA